MTVAPDSGYVLDILHVIGSKGSGVKLTVRGGGKYTFVIPGKVVMVNAAFNAAS